MRAYNNRLQRSNGYCHCAKGNRQIYTFTYVLCLFVCMYVLLCKLMFLSNMSTNALVWRLTGFLCPKTQLRLLLTTYVHTF